MTINEVKNKVELAVTEMVARKDNYVNNPGKDFSRDRKLSLEKLCQFFFTAQGSSISKELEKFFNFSMDTPTASAFIQQRAKLNPQFFLDLLRTFNSLCSDDNMLNGYRVFAVDGTTLNIAKNSNSSSFINSGCGYNQLHISAVFDLLNGTYCDAVIKSINEANERADLIDILHRNTFLEKTIFVLDRGYPSHEIIATFDNTPNADYLIRVNQGNDTFKVIRGLPMKAFDINVEFEITTTQTNEDKAKQRVHISLKKTLARSGKTIVREWNFPSPYTMRFRVVRFMIANKPDKNGNIVSNPANYETIITSLPSDIFSLDEIKRLYGMRWGIETSFRCLKYTVGMVNTHAKNEAYIMQEVYSKLFAFNVLTRITKSVAKIVKTKHTYTVNISLASDFVRLFVLSRLTKKLLLEKLKKYVVPIRPGRKDKRKLKTKECAPFIYRVA